ncbi:unnamed protein product [[Candida] boidinii]|uniref:Unnamed protein product n=1 Tax=Candida boidinii TaxID=5477 RepID=A0A9W6SYN2_CANBO|nr:unnamed protein product [[Candida] boidinii]
MAAQIPQRKLQLRDKQLAHRAAGGTNVRCANENFVCAPWGQWGPWAPAWCTKQVARTLERECATTSWHRSSLQLLVVVVFPYAAPPPLSMECSSSSIPYSCAPAAAQLSSAHTNGRNSSIDNGDQWGHACHGSKQELAAWNHLFIDRSAYAHSSTH